MGNGTWTGEGACPTNGSRRRLPHYARISSGLMPFSWHHLR